MVFTDKHKALLEKEGASLAELQRATSKEKNRYIASRLLPYVCGDGTEEEEELADDLITMITVWEPGQASDE